jgi:hypothetical protein
LYETASLLPRTETKKQIKAAVNITVGGPLDEVNEKILAATNADGKLLAVKILGPVSDPLARKEEEAWKFINAELPDQPFVKALHFGQYRHDAPVRFAVMDRMHAILAKTTGTSDQFVLTQARLLSVAVSSLHSKKIIHMDIKGSNCFLGHDGHWILGDFGCAVQIGEPVTSYTESCHPEKLIGKPAEPKYDWVMFCFMVVNESRKANNKVPRSSAKLETLTTDVEDIPLPELKEFCTALLTRS